tara:strand:+ start:136 stop:393 length:258 start_codon:yes stop_codon:yes gene_type:complete
MDNASYFIDNKALFGSYPDEICLKELQDNGVKIFVDVTNENDHLQSYRQYLKDSDIYINFPIDDRKYPENATKFIQLLLKIKTQC